MKESNDGPGTPAMTAPDDHLDPPDSASAKRRGWLKHGNAPGDFHNCARCGAKTRTGTACKSPAMRNGRCRMHGGKSTGPRTWEGRKKCAETHTVNGHYSREYLEQERALRLASRANVITSELSIHRLFEAAAQLGITMPQDELPRLSPSKVEKKMAQSQRILEQLWEIPSFRALRSVRQRRKLRKHLREGKTEIKRSCQPLPKRRDEFEKTAKQCAKRAQAALAIGYRAAQEAMAAVRSETPETEELIARNQELTSSSETCIASATREGAEHPTPVLGRGTSDKKSSTAEVSFTSRE